MLVLEAVFPLHKVAAADTDGYDGRVGSEAIRMSFREYLRDSPWLRDDAARCLESLGVALLPLHSDSVDDTDGYKVDPGNGGGSSSSKTMLLPPREEVVLVPAEEGRIHWRIHFSALLSAEFVLLSVGVLLPLRVGEDRGSKLFTAAACTIMDAVTVV